MMFHSEHPDGIAKEDYVNSTKVNRCNNNSYGRKYLLFCQEYVLNEALFRVFDEDKSGTLNFFEWYQATNVKNMSSIEEKLNWIFMAFDADNGGSIDLNEIREIVIWMFRFAGIEEDPDLLASCVIDVR